MPVLRGAAAEAARTVVRVMRKGTAKDRMSLAAAREILDRILGKPVPRTERVDNELPKLLVEMIHPKGRRQLLGNETG